MENRELIIEEIKSFRLPRYSELPDMGLYLEQVVKYINSCLSPLRCVEITPSMVSNYVKKGLIANPVKKQYYASHLAELFFVVLGKRALSIEYIGKMLEMIKASVANHIIYDYCCAELESRLRYVFGVSNNIPSTDFEETEEKMVLDEVITAVVFSIHLELWFKDHKINND